MFLFVWPAKELGSELGLELGELECKFFDNLPIEIGFAVSFHHRRKHEYARRALSRNDPFSERSPLPDMSMVSIVFDCRNNLRNFTGYCI